MNILLLTPYYPAVGGIATWAQGIVEVSEKSSDKIFILDEAEKVHGKKNFFSSVIRSFRIWKDLKKNLKNINLDIVHINIPAHTMSMIRELVSIRIAKKYRKKVIMHFHCTLTTAVDSRTKARLMKKICKKVDAVITLNRQSYDFVLPFAKEKAFILPNFASEQLLEAGASRKINPKLQTVLYVGNIIPEKGCNELIQLSKEFPDIQFRLVGRLGKGVNTDGLPSNCILTGIKTGADLKKEFIDADVFAFLSYMPMEGFSVALTEAMAYGLPCLATRWAANEDMLEGKGGIIVETKNIEEMRKALVEISDYDLRKSFSLWNLQKVEGEYTRQAVWNQLNSIYKKI